MGNGFRTTAARRVRFWESVVVPLPVVKCSVKNWTLERWRWDYHALC